MLVEIPDPEVILSVVVAFLVGLGGLYLFYRLRPLVRQNGVGPAQIERLEYYERQLIDMKIRLDAIEMQGVEQKSAESEPDLKQIMEKLVKDAVKEQQVEEQAPKPKVQVPATPSFDHSNAVEYVLHLITHKAMTSRDIQITLKRSREHTSRLMKKLFEEGYVQRTQTKPYVYSITQKGREKLGEAELKTVAV